MAPNTTDFMAGKKIGTSDLVASVVLVIIGAYYALLPHTLHVSSGFGFGFDHIVHIVLGVVLLVAGAGYYAKKAGLLKK